MKTIAVIGAGQLGSRHLQSLSKLNIETQIEVVDTFGTSLETAKIRFEEMPANANIQGIRYLSSIKELSRYIDFVVVATNADVRASVLRELLATCDVKNILLEKVLFQKAEDYAEFLEVFASKGIQVWVNHPRRQFPYYHELKQDLAGSTQISYHVQGGAWGLACNSLHFIDHLAFLTGEDSLQLSGQGLNPSVIQSKRKGFVELSGTLSGRVGQHPFTLFCHDASSPVSITICSDNLNAIIDEGSGLVRLVTKEGGWKWEEKKVRIIRFQSELTSSVVEQVITTGICDLPTYAEAVKLHLPFIDCLKDFLEKVENIKYDHCPIT